MIETLATIDAVTHPKKFFGGIVLWDDKVVVTPPCFRFMSRWSRDRVREHCREQGWKVSVVYEMTRADEVPGKEYRR